VFIETFVNTNIGHWKIPPATFAALEPLFVALGAPIITYFWLRFDRPYSSLTLMKVAGGLFLGGIGFLLLAFLADFLPIISAMHLPLLLIVIGNLFIGFGELCIAPSVLSFIAHLTPERFRGTMMGIYYLALAFSGYLAGLIAENTHKITIRIEISTVSLSPYVYTYFTLAGSAMTVAIILWIIAHRINLDAI
ncbi:MAG: hypothetical protein ACK4PR_10010, partial [Gammaproteobacteria bacterium]